MPEVSALLLGDDVFPWHDVHERGPEIEAALGDSVAVETTTDRDRLLDLEEFDVFVDYLSDSTMTDEQREALFSFVESGGGYLGIHCAVDLTSTHDGAGGIDARDEPFPELRALLGGHFLGHPEEGTFSVEIERDHPITDGVEDFEVYDEPYRVDVDTDANADADAVTVLARMDHPAADMDDYPVLWVKEYGDGTVGYCSLGHTTESFEHETHRRILRNAIGYITDGARGG